MYTSCSIAALWNKNGCCYLTNQLPEKKYTHGVRERERDLQRINRVIDNQIKLEKNIKLQINETYRKIAVVIYVAYVHIHKYTIYPSIHLTGGENFLVFHQRV